MATLISKDGIKPAPGRVNLIIINDEVHTSSSLATKMGVLSSLISSRMIRHINGLIPFESICDTERINNIGVTIEGKIYRASDIMRITGYSSTTVQKRLNRYREGNLTKKQLMESKLTANIKESLYVPPIAKKGRTLKEIDAEYAVELRKHKLNTRTHVYGVRGGYNAI